MAVSTRDLRIGLESDVYHAAEGGPVVALDLGESFPSAYEVVRPLFPELSSICGTSLDSFDTGFLSSLYQCASTNA